VDVQATGVPQEEERVNRWQRRKIEQALRDLRDANDLLHLRLVHQRVMSVEKWDDFQLSMKLAFWEVDLARHFGSVEVEH